MTSQEELAWFAGLLEGEGCFHWSQVGAGITIGVKLAMTDRDIVERSVSFMEGRPVKAIKDRRPGYKTCYTLCVRGYAAERVMKKVLSYMGKRRTEKILECLKKWEGRPLKQRENGLPPSCHPDRPYHAQGMCAACYVRVMSPKWRATRRAKLAAIQETP